MANVLIEIDFPDSSPGGFTTEYFAIERTVYNGKQYQGKIAADIEVLENMSLEKSFENPVITIVIYDDDGEYRKKYVHRNKKYWQNANVALRYGDGSLMRTAKIESWAFPEARWKINLSNKIDMSKEFTERIDSTTWPWAETGNPDAIGEAVPMVYNTTGRIKAWRVGPGNTDYTFLISKTTISSVTEVWGGGQTWNATYWSLETDGSYYYLKMNHGVILGRVGDFCWVTVTTPNYTPVQIISDMLSGTVTVAANTDFKTYLANQGYTAANCRYYLDRNMSPSEALKVFCDSFESNWRTDTQDRVIFTYIDRGNISVSKLFRETEIPLKCTQSTDYQPLKLKNEITYYFDRDYWTGDYNGKAIYNGDNKADWGTVYDSVEFEYLGESVQAGKTAIERHYMNREPSNIWSIGMDLETGKNYFPGDTIQIEHYAMKTPNPVFCIILRKRMTPGADTVEFSVIDRNYLFETFYILNEDGCFMLDEQGYKIIAG